MQLTATLLACLGASALAFAPFAPAGAPLRRQTRLRADAEEAATGDRAQAISALTASVETVFPLEDIAATLPHRYPFALVDKIVEYEPGKRAVGIKQITNNEPQFTGHFPDRPIMPGVLMVEALAQLTGIVCLKLPENEVKEGEDPPIFFFAGIDGVSLLVARPAAAVVTITRL